MTALSVITRNVKNISFYEGTIRQGIQLFLLVDCSVCTGKMRRRNNNNNNNNSRSQGPRGLRRRSEAARLLRSWVRIPPGEWMSVCCECCVLSGRGLCDELILVQRSPTDCGVSLCVI